METENRTWRVAISAGSSPAWACAVAIKYQIVAQGFEPHESGPDVYVMVVKERGK